VFNNPDFVTRNAIARELEKVVTALTSKSFSRADFLSNLDYFYKAIEEAARTISDYSEKQSFLNTVYEQFFRSYSTDTADTHGIVYTPAPIVKWMVASVEKALQQEFGKSLSDTGVHVLDPCVGTGTFMLELMERIGNSNLPHKYAHELHCNEVLLLPYYIAAQNIEHEYFERTGEYKPFDGIVFADTLDMKRVQADMFAPENTERIAEQEKTEIFAIIGNPPYNIGQKSENDNNKNRAYPEIDKRIEFTYVASSKARKSKLKNMYVRFFRWATDRLGNRDGIICFITPNSFAIKNSFDGMRIELMKDFTKIIVLDLGGSIKDNQKLSGTTHNVFGIPDGVAITLLIRNRAANSSAEPMQYFSVDEYWTKEQKYKFLESESDFQKINWEKLEQDKKGHWLNEGIEENFDHFLAIGVRSAKKKDPVVLEKIFITYSPGISTNRDKWAYSYDIESLTLNIQKTIEFFNDQSLKYQHRKNMVKVDDFVKTDDKFIGPNSLAKTMHFSARL
jgi:predicted helicase